MHEIYEPHRFYQNKGCKYFPCHDLVESDLSKALFNCMFCYCPLYALGKDCGGNFKINKSKDGKLIKDCSDCVLPHRPEMYEYINQKLGELELNLKDDEPIEKSEKPSDSPYRARFNLRNLTRILSRLQMEKRSRKPSVRSKRWLIGSMAFMQSSRIPRPRSIRSYRTISNFKSVLRFVSHSLVSIVCCCD